MMLGEERRKKILRELSFRGAITVTSLRQTLGYSETTLRRDLQRMAEAGLLRRAHGGAVIDVVDDPIESSPTAKAVLHADEKQAIGAAAARLVTPGDTLALNGGTTTAQVARALRGLTPLRLVTNSIGVASDLAGQPGIEVTLTGGTVRGSLELSGPHGLTTYDQVEAQTNRAIIAHAERVVVVADHTKIGRVTMALIAPYQAVHTLVTDEAASADDLDALRERGIEVIIAR